MASLGSSEGVDDHAVSHGTEGLFRKDFSTHVADLALGRNVKKLALSESNKFFESMISDVDVFHTAMQNGIFRALYASDVVLVELGRYFVVKESLGKPWCCYVLWNKQTIDSGSVEVDKLANESTEPGIFTSCIGGSHELGFTCRHSCGRL